MSTKEKISENALFQKEVEKSYSEWRQLYNDQMERNGNAYSEQVRRQRAMEECRSKRTANQKNSSLLFCMYARYAEYLKKYFRPGDIRFKEWMKDEWKVYKQEHLGQSGSDDRKMTRAQVRHFLASEVAFKRMEDNHTSELSRIRARISAEEDASEPIKYEKEPTRRPQGAFNNMQATAFIITLIDELCQIRNAGQELIRTDGEVGDYHTNIYNINVAALANAMTLLSGLSEDNHKKNIQVWKRGSYPNIAKELEAVRKTIKGLGLDISTSRLDDAINKAKGH